MAQYATTLPVDRNNNPYTVSVPNFVSNAAWSSVFTVSSTVGLNDRTTVLQIAAIGAAATIKWGSGSITATSFDATIPANTQSMFVIPIQNVANPASLMGANGANGLYNQISLKTVGGNTGSIFAAEF